MTIYGSDACLVQAAIHAWSIHHHHGLPLAHRYTSCAHCCHEFLHTFQRHSHINSDAGRCPAYRHLCITKQHAKAGVLLKKAECSLG